jgi:general secretion pathway protein D
MFQLFWKPHSFRFRRSITAFSAACFMFSALPAFSQIVPALEEDNLISLKFVNAPLDLVLDQYSDITGRTLIKSQGLNASITLKSKTKLTHTEALIAIESTLQLFNVAFVPLGDKFLKVVQTANVRSSGKDINIEMPEGVFPETDLLVSQVVTLKFIEIAEAKPVLEALKQSYGIIQELERTNSLLITDTAQNLKRMLQMLEYIDRPISIKEDIFVREIKYSQASEIASKLNELIQDAQEDEDSSRRRISTPQPRTQIQAPAGVIRARQAAAAQQASQPGAGSGATAAELAERGIIQGKVRIVADDRTSILFIISRPENFAFFDKIISVLDQAIDPQFEVRVLAMEYAEAEEVAGILNEFIGAASAEEDTPAGGSDAENAGTPEATRSQALRDFVQRRAQQAAAPEASEEPTEFGRLSPNTRILADPRTNSIMLMGRKPDIAALEELIDQLDIMLGQVLIEAVILEVLLDDGVSHGVDWLQRSFLVNNEEKVGPGGGVTVSQPVLGFGGGQNLSGRESFIDGATVGRDTPIASALTYYMSLYDLNVDAVINLAASSSDARILSTPVIMTADNTEAQIIVGEERPVVGTTSTTTAGSIRSSFEYRTIGINLTVTPRINPDRMVVMEINQTADDVGGEVLIDGNSVPIITKREL